MRRGPGKKEAVSEVRNAVEVFLHEYYMPLIHRLLSAIIAL